MYLLPWAQKVPDLFVGYEEAVVNRVFECISTELLLAERTRSNFILLPLEHTKGNGEAHTAKCFVLFFQFTSTKSHLL